MSDLILNQYRALFDSIRQFENGLEFWSARDLMAVLGYVRWERFAEAIARAKEACKNSGSNESDHFRGAAKMIHIGKGGARNIADFHLSRYSCYLIAMNGDPRKPQIAAAQSYFAVSTYQNEQRQLADGHPQAELPPVSIEDIGAAGEVVSRFFGERYGQRFIKVNFERHHPRMTLPKAEESELAPYAQPDAHLIPTDIARILGLYDSKGNPSPRKANRLLEELGYQQKIGDRWTPIGKGLEHSQRKVVDVGGRTDKDQLVWFPSIIDQIKAAGV